MDYGYRPTRIEVSIANYKHNYNAIKNLAARKNSKVMAVVKANAYGMGAVKVSRILKDEGVDFFAVATPDEALELYESGIETPILVLGSSPYRAAELYVKLGIRATITDVKMAEAMSAVAARLGRPAFVHLKVDTGMGRIGFMPQDAINAAEIISKLPGVEFEGIFTHFATADEGNLEYMREQYKNFKEVTDALKRAGIKIKMEHCCNSGALLANLQEMFGDYVRPGEILHGIVVSEACGQAIEVMPSFELKTEVGVVRELPANMGVGYGLTYTTKKITKTAVLPIGYADGYSRALSNCGEVLIKGTRCPLIGRVSMDQCVADISCLDGVCVGDEVVLIGKQGKETITLAEIAKKISLPSLSVQVMFMSRIPRVYI